MRKNQGSTLASGVTFSFNLSPKQNYSFESYLNELARSQKASIEHLKSNLTYLRKRDDILRRFKNDYNKIVSPELAKILMRYFSENEADKLELEQYLTKYKPADKKDLIENKLKIGSVYKKSSLNNNDQELLDQLNMRLIGEFNNLFKVQNKPLRNILDGNKQVVTKSWSKRISPYDCTEEFFIPFDGCGDSIRHSQVCDPDGNMRLSVSWNNQNNKGDGTSVLDYESKLWTGIGLKNSKSGKLKVVVRLKCKDYSFSNFSYSNDCVASSFYTNLRSEIVFRINSDVEDWRLINCGTSDIDTDPNKIGYFHENHNEGDEIVIGFEFDKAIPADSVLWIGLRNRVFSVQQNLESTFYQRECLRLEEVSYLIEN